MLITSHCRRGLSLIETLVAASLCLLVLGVASACVQMGVAAYHQGDNRATAFRQAANAMNAMVAESRNCTHIYQPDQTAAQQDYPLQGAPFVFASSMDGSPSVVAYVLKTNSIQRFLYNADYTPGMNEIAQPNSSRVLDRDFQALTLRYSQDNDGHEFLKFSAQITTDDSMETSVRIIRGFANRASASNGTALFESLFAPFNATGRGHQDIKRQGDARA